MGVTNKNNTTQVLRVWFSAGEPLVRVEVHGRAMWNKVVNPIWALRLTKHGFWRSSILRLTAFSALLIALRLEPTAEDMKQSSTLLGVFVTQLY